MSNLLQTVRFDSKAVKAGKTPVMMEFEVDPESAPFLVSSSSSVLWVAEAHPGNIVKAAVRKIDSTGTFFMEVVDAVASLGREVQWGNVHPLTPEGVQAAIDHIKEYELPDPELLIPILAKVKEGDDVPPPERPFYRSMGIPTRPTSWLPEDCVVVVPKDRSYVGFVGHLTPADIVSVVHNPSRGVAIARGQG